jgi:hypothetical protein
VDTITLAGENLILTFDAKNGALTNLRAGENGWQILRRAALSLSWRLLVPVSDELRNNPVYGENQPLAACERGDGYVCFRWENVVSERAGALDIAVTVRVSIGADGAIFETTVENHSPYVVESVYSPYLGDVSRPEDEPWFKAFVYDYASAQEWNLWPHFDNREGYFGVDYPTQFGQSMNCGAPTAPFFLLRGARQGLYVGVHAPSSELVAWHCELRPGYGSSIDARVPDADEIGGKPVHIRAAAVHMPYLRPGETRTLTPIRLKHYVGTWEQGTDIYKAWRDTWAARAKVPAWAREPHAWLQLHINSPEDELRLRFADLPKVALECRDAGISVIQLVGWNDGGQDQGNPSHSHDPRLGTARELKAAIKACQALGVKIVLFAKFTWADRATARYRRSLHKCAIRDPYGDEYVYGGYKYQTPAQLLDINTKRLVPMCFGDEAYRRVCRREFQKLVRYGCDGILYDECQHHSPALLCFDARHGNRPGWPVYALDRELIYDLRASGGVSDDFLFAGEAPYDWELEAYGLSYFRSENKRHIPLSRYMRPDAQLMTAVTGFDDRDMLNQCLMYRYIVSYEPYNFKGWPHDFPDTIRYGRMMHALREELRALLWDGEYLGASGGHCGAHEPYGVFRGQDGARAMVICNYEDAPVTVHPALDGQSSLTYRFVDDPAWRAADGGVLIPPHSAAVVR